MIPRRLCKDNSFHFLVAIPFQPATHIQGLTPTGLLWMFTAWKWMTFAVIVSLCLSIGQHLSIDPYPGRRQPLLGVLSYFLTRETERRITNCLQKQSIMSCNCNKEQWPFSRPQPTHTGIEAPGRALRGRGLALGPTGKIQIGLRIFSDRFWLEPTPCTPLFCFICNIIDIGDWADKP